MSKAIGINVTKANDGYDEGASKFFGAPAIPAEWQDIFDDDEMFFCQIRCSDIAQYDEQNILPHSGYIYVFLNTASYPYKPRVMYYDGEPDTVIDDFNAEVDGAQHLIDGWLMSFSEAEESSEGNRLLGVPADWNYDGKKPEVFLQYDPLASDMGFADNIDGYIYLVFSDDAHSLDKVEYIEERS